MAKHEMGLNKMVVLLLIAVMLFSGYLFFKVRTLEQKLSQSAAPGAAQGNGPSPLSVDNLKKYAKDLGLNTNKFNSCLDGNAKKDAVTTEENYGASLGVQGTPGFFINGKFLAGAFPYEFFKEIIDREIPGNSSSNCNDYSKTLQSYCSDPNNKSFDPVSKNVDLGNSPSEGASNPKVVLVEFADFQCPFCVKAYPVVKRVLQDYKNDVRLYYKQFPLNSIHPYAEKAAEASLCVLDQGGQDKFWKFHDKLFESQGQGQ